MQLKLTAMAFALAFALSACDDSGTSANSDSNGGSVSAANPEADVQAMQNGSWHASKSCDFKVTDKAWKYSYWGKEDEKITETYEFVSDKVKITRVEETPSWDAEKCNSFAREHEEGKWNDETMKFLSATCAGNILITVQEVTTSAYTDDGALVTTGRQDVYDGVLMQCKIELDIYDFPSDEI